jgi:APA family basic amino acid/polyamine antiporter
MSNQPETRRTLGFWMLTALVAGNMIGSGIFLLPASLASFGSISLLGWIFTSVGAISLALVFAKMSSLFTRVGGPYAYCREGFGDFIGFQVAYNYWVAVWVGNAAIAIAFAGYLGVFWPSISNNPVNSCLVAMGAVWFVTVVNIIGVRQAGIMQLMTTILKLLPLILIATVGIFFIDIHNITDHFNISGKSNFSALTGAATLTLWSFIGLESATVPADDVQDPKRNIPRATIIGTLITALVYILSTIAVMGVIPFDQLAHSTAPYAEAAKQMFGAWGGWLIAVGAVISCFGALNGWVLLQGQVPLAAARDKLFLHSFAHESKNQTPIVGLVVSSILISLLLLLTLNKTLVQQFTFIILLATLSQLIPYLFTAMAELVIFIRERERFKASRIFSSVVIAIVASIYAFWTIGGSGQETVYYGTLLWFSSLPVYVWMQWQTRRREIAAKI